MKKLISFFLSIVMLFSITACVDLSAYADTSGDFNYSVSGSGATITGYNGSATSVTIPSEIDGCPVKSIGSYAFYNCKSLTSVAISNSVTSIGVQAFENCTSLTSVTIGDSVTSIGDRAFYNCTKLNKVNISSIESWCKISFGGYSSNPLYYAKNLYLNDELVTDLVIPDSVTSIGDYAFYYCKSLTSVTIPNSVTSIGNSAFRNCTSLISVTIPNSVTSIGNYAFSSCTSLTSVTIPDSVTSIGDYAFYSCKSLTSVTIPNSVTSIGQAAFGGVINIVYNGSSSGSPWGAKNINGYVDGYLVYKDSTKKELLGCSAQATSVTIPDSVTSIGDYAFEDCTSLTSVIIPNSVTSIGYDAFYNCTSLTSVTIPNSVTSIGDYAFYGCTSLTSATIPNSVTSIGYSTFGHCSSLTSVTIPNSVTSIGSYAFNECTSLTSVTIPDSVTSIGDSAFSYCTSLTSVTISDSVTSIGEWAFSYCTSLTSVTIPESVTSIGSAAFDGCTSLTTIYILNKYCNIYKDYYTIPKSTTIYGLNGSTAQSYANSYRGKKFEIINNCNDFGLEHTESYSQNTNVVYSTCTESGSYDVEITCKNCNVYSIETFITEPLGHSFTNYISNEDATCTENGTKTAKCDRCDETDTITDEGTALDHIESELQYINNVVSSTCTESGSYDVEHRCKNCNTVISSETFITEPLGHSFTNYISNEDATCTENGTKTAKCDRCDETDTITDEGTALGHIESEVQIENRIESTCQKEGSYDEVIYCSRCNEELSRNTKTIDKSHKYSLVSVIEPSCMDDGFNIYQCNFCEQFYTEQVEPLGHEVVIDEAVEPSCTETGLTEGSHCSRCNTVIVKQVSVQKIPHDYTSYITNATCTEQGYITYTCTRCDESYTEITSEPLGHNVVIDAAVEPTCTTTGLTEGSHCSVCNMILTKQEIIEALGHSYVLTRTSATCTSNGFNIYTCSACKTLKTQAQEALGHEYEITTNIPPTDTEDGYITYTCNRCNDSYTEVIPATGETHTHTWGEWVYNGDAKYVSASNYTDGTATRTCACGETETKTIAGTGLLRARTATAKFESELKMCIATRTEQVNQFKEVYCVFTREDGVSITVPASKSYEIQNSTNSNTYFDFGVTPQGLNSPVKIRFYGITNDDITVWGDDYTYVMTTNYILKQLRNSASSETLKNLFVEMLYYGYENQIYSNWDLEHPLTDLLTEEEKARHTTGALTLKKYQNTAYVTCENPETTWRSVSLVLGAATKIKYRTRSMTLSDDLKAVVEVAGESEPYTYYYNDPEDAKCFAEDGEGGIYFTFPDLAVKRLRSKVYVTLYKGDRPIINTFEYSAETYAYGRKVGTTEYPLTQQQMRFADAARAYFGI